MELNELYTEVITEYSRSKKHHYNLENHDVSMRGVNTSCGDDIEVQLIIHDDIIEKIAFSGSGCAISQASAEIMADLVEGKTKEEAKRKIDIFLGMIKKTVTDEKELDILEDAIAFRNISNMPARVKCAVLAWRTLEQILNN